MKARGGWTEGGVLRKRGGGKWKGAATRKQKMWAWRVILYEGNVESPHPVFVFFVEEREPERYC